MNSTLPAGEADSPKARWIAVRSQFGEKLKQLRQRRGLAQWEFFPLFDVGEKLYQRLEAGTYPEPQILADILGRLKAALGLPPKQVAERGGPNESKVERLSVAEIDSLEIPRLIDQIWPRQTPDSAPVGIEIFERQQFGEARLTKEFEERPPQHIDLVDYSAYTWLNFLRICLMRNPKVRINLYTQTMEQALRSGSARQVDRIGEALRNLFGTDLGKDIASGHLRLTQYPTPGSFFGIRFDSRMILLSWFIWYPHLHNASKDATRLIAPYADNLRPAEAHFGDSVKLYGDAHPHLLITRRGDSDPAFAHLNALFSGVVDHFNAFLNPTVQRTEFEVTIDRQQLVLTHRTRDQIPKSGKGRVILRPSEVRVSDVFRPALVEFDVTFQRGTIIPKKGAAIPDSGEGVLVLS